MMASTGEFYNKTAKEYAQTYGYDEHLALPSLKDFLTLLPAHAKVLDVGCGGGQDSKFLADNDCSVLGIDISKEMIKLAKKHAPEADFKVTDVIDLPARIKYDGIWCCRVFHHIAINDQEKFVHKLHMLLKKNGVLYITSVVSDKEDYETNEDVIRKRLTEKSFKKLMTKNGFKILEFKYRFGKKAMDMFAKKIWK
jgi:2-polyprenyl-3-methyl-5-hydroxy-6-metoxy-1,4-benzoquinol methylase